MISPDRLGKQTHASATHSNFEHVVALLAHMRLQWLLQHFPPRLVWALYVCVNGFITIGLLALLALLTGSPFVFPSLGPTAYLFFFSPLAEASSPRNTILGHAIGLICGYAAFAVTIASSPPFAMHPGVHGPRVLAAALSLSATGALMALFRVSHPPAGATTLIVSLGIISQPKELVIIEVAVILLTVQAFAINRLAGIPYPFWRCHKPQGTAS
jgi:CBS domain-containing membrane protein